MEAITACVKGKAKTKGWSRVPQEKNKQNMLVSWANNYIYIYIYIYICIYSIQQNLAYKPFMYTSLWQVLTMLNNRRTYIEGLQASKKSVQKEQLWRLALTLSKYIFIYWRVWTLMHQNKSRVILINLYTLTLSCIFSILFVIHFLRCWQGEFVCQSKGSFPGVWPFPLFSWP